MQYEHKPGTSLLFTYGILQGRGTVVDKHYYVRGLMYDLGSFPGVTAVEPTLGHTIFGQVLEVTAEELLQFDIIEGVANGLYRRQEFITDYGPTWIYLYNGPTTGLKPISMWKNERYNKVVSK